MADATPSDDEAPDGKLIDFVSGALIPAKPEEMLAVQPFARQLVEDYGYPKTHLRTRPQWHVKASPSDFAKSLPGRHCRLHGESAPRRRPLPGRRVQEA